MALLICFEVTFSGAHRISTWWCQISLWSMFIQSNTKVKFSDAYKISTWWSKISLWPMSIQSNTKAKFRNTYQIKTWRSQVSLWPMSIQSNKKVIFKNSFEIKTWEFWINNTPIICYLSFCFLPRLKEGYHLSPNYRLCSAPGFRRPRWRWRCWSGRAGTRWRPAAPGCPGWRSDWSPPLSGLSRERALVSN